MSQIDNGEGLDDQQIAGRNLKVTKVVLPSGVNPIDFGYGATPENYVYQPNSQNNVKGISAITELTFDSQVFSNPSYYQVCALLETVEFEKVIDYSCVPMDQIIDPQTPIDTSTTITPNDIESAPDSSVLETQDLTQPAGLIYDNEDTETQAEEFTKEPASTEDIIINNEEL